MDFSFPKKKRVRRKFDFDAVFATKVFAADELLVINALARYENEFETRLGLSIGRNFGNSPQRNRWKRLIREAFRLEQHRLPAALDIVVRPRKGAADPTLEMLRRSIVQLSQRIDRQLKRSSDRA